jgi:hypothetical protein
VESQLAIELGKKRKRVLAKEQAEVLLKKRNKKMKLNVID